KPVSNWRLNLIPVTDVNYVNNFGLRCLIDASHLRRLYRSAKKYTQLKKIPLWPHEEVAGITREHDRLVRGIDPLVSERDGRLAQSLPRFPQVIRQMLRESCFRGGPAIVLLAFLDRFLAVITNATHHSLLVTYPGHVIGPE